MKRTVKDWLVILVVLLDEVIVVALVFLALWLLGVEIPLPVIIVTALLLGGIIFITYKLVIPALHKKRITGSDGMIGLEGTVIEPLTPVGAVRVEGENWKAKSVGENIAVGEEVEILGLEGLTLRVSHKNK
jgi:membrane-bound serine protease (ClpP class)